MKINSKEFYLIAQKYLGSKCDKPTKEQYKAFLAIQKIYQHLKREV